MDSSFEKYFNFSLKFLSYRPRSEKEVRDRLAQKKCDPQIIEKIISRLLKLKFLNDKQFAQWFVEQRTRVRPKGPHVIKMELLQKGINKEIIEQVLGNTQASDMAVENIKVLLAKRKERLRGLSHQEMRNKLGQFLIRRGFDFDTARKLIDELQEKRV